MSVHKFACDHANTTSPDGQGYVICCKCLVAIHRPLTEQELYSRIKG